MLETSFFPDMLYTSITWLTRLMFGHPCAFHVCFVFCFIFTMTESSKSCQHSHCRHARQEKKANKHWEMSALLMCMDAWVTMMHSNNNQSYPLRWMFDIVKWWWFFPSLINYVPPWFTVWKRIFFSVELLNVKVKILSPTSQLSFLVLIIFVEVCHGKF